MITKTEPAPAPTDYTLIGMADVEEKEPEWLIPNYIPSHQITTVAAEGGIGKTTFLCSIAASISNGKITALEQTLKQSREPQKVVYFSAEDSLEYTLKRRLRKNGANLENVYSIDISDKRFDHVKFNDDFLKHLLEENKPALCIFDPIQAFVPPEIHMGDRNAMRNCLAPLIGYGEKFGTTFIIVIHSNKQSGVWGRKRIADSSDMWDISRSVLMMGNTSEDGVKYLSHEKSNYGALSKTMLFRIVDERIQFEGYTDKRDRDFVMSQMNTHQAPVKNDAKAAILEFLSDGELLTKDLEQSCKALGYSDETIKRAKSELKRDGKIDNRNTGQGKNKKFYTFVTGQSLDWEDEISTDDKPI